MPVKKLICLIIAAALLLVSLPVTSFAAFTGDERVVIVLDPGHGGGNIGSAYNGVGEKVYTFRLATYLKQFLEENGNFIVYMTREGDWDLELCERGIFANTHNADAFISLHFDGSTDKNQHGVTVYTSVFDYAALVTLGASVASNVAASVGMSSNGVKRRPDTQYYWSTEYQWDIKDPSLGILSDYYGLPTWGAKFGIPTMIVEHGFLSNPSDGALISSGTTIEKMARAEADSIIAYYTNHTHTYGAMKQDYPSNCMFVGKQSEHCTVCGHRRNIQSLAPAPDNHYWENEVTVPATCGHDGSITRVCRITNNLIDKKYKNITNHESVQIIPAPTQHDFAVISEDAATHTKDGYIQYKCKTCSETFKDILYAEGHTWESIGHADPTCTTDGGTTFRCTVCSEEFLEVDARAYGHSYTVTDETLPTCTEDGVRTSVCSVCSHTSEEILPSTGHDTSLCESVSASCTADGYLRGECSVCSEKIDEVYPAAGHSFSRVVKKAATCTEGGESHKECTVCGETADETTSPLGHYYLMTSYIESTCDRKGAAEFVCDRCGAHTAGTMAIAEHSYEITSEKASGLFSAGEQHLTCEYCSDSITQKFSFSCVDIAVRVFGCISVLCLAGSVTVLAIFIIRRKKNNEIASSNDSESDLDEVEIDDIEVML